MKRLLLTLCTVLIYTSLMRAQPLTMRDVFATMPDSVLPLVNKYARLICLDLFENHMKAEARNTLDEFVEMEALTTDYVRFRTSSASILEMKLLPLTPLPANRVPADRVSADTLSSDTLSVDTVAATPSLVLCLVTTAESGSAESPLYLADSNLRFLRPDWTPLDTALHLSPFVLPSANTFLATPQTQATPSDSLQVLDAARRSLADFHPVRIALSPDDLMLTLTLQTAFLPTDERQAIAPHLRTLRYRWHEHTFVPDTLVRP